MQACRLVTKIGMGMVKPGSYLASAIPRTQSSKAGNGWTEADVAKAGFGLSYSGSVGASPYLKFSAVLGTTSANSSIFMRPTSCK